MRSALSALVAIAAFAIPQLAHADAMDSFTLTGPDVSLSFSAPAKPKPISTESFLGFPFYFEIGPLSFVENGVTHTMADAYFYTVLNGGGFALDDADQNVLDGLSFYGPSLFSGSINAPTFKLDTFNLLQADSLLSDPYKLTISAVTATPEPESLLLLGTGALSAVGLLRRRTLR